MTVQRTKGNFGGWVPSICVRENLYLHFLNFVCVCACNREGTSHTSSRVDGRLE
jgi:hypothetical protein